MANIDILTDKDYDLMGRAVKLGEDTKARLQEVAKGIGIIGKV